MPRPKNFSNQGLTYCRPDKRPVALLEKINLAVGGTHCPTCHFRVRGADHEKGKHHTAAAAKASKNI